MADTAVMWQLMVILPVITLIVVWTNNIHHLMWKIFGWNQPIPTGRLLVNSQYMVLGPFLLFLRIAFLGTLCLLDSFRNHMAFSVNRRGSYYWLRSYLGAPIYCLLSGSVLRND